MPYWIFFHKILQKYSKVIPKAQGSLVNFTALSCHLPLSHGQTLATVQGTATLVRFSLLCIKFDSNDIRKQGFVAQSGVDYSGT